jgi:hypothetical protein
MRIKRYIPIKKQNDLQFRIEIVQYISERLENIWRTRKGVTTLCTS